MYYYGYNGSYGMNSNPCYMQAPTYAGYTNGGYSWGAALWIVLFILLVIIVGAGWTGHNND